MSPLWRNWTGDQRCAPAAVELPRSESEVVRAVERAAASGATLRVAGAGHSFSDIACTDGHMLQLGRMGRILEADPASGLVEVEPGLSIRELGLRLAALGLALENQGDIDAQGISGAIATGTHGTGLRFRNVSSQVARLRLVTAGGEVIECAEDSDPELMRAARVSLGSLGVITALTLQCVPLFTIHRRDEPRELATVLEELDSLAESNDHFEFFTLPYTSLAMVLRSERTDRPPEPPNERALYLREAILENRVLELASRAGRSAPGLVPWLNRRLASLAGPLERIDRSFRVYANRRDVRFTEMEYAIPRAAGAEAVRRVLALIERRRLPVGFPLEVRFVAADDAHLSPSHRRDTCYVAVHMYRGMEFESYFRGVEAIMDDYDGRPHWGKRHYQTAATLAPRYPEWEGFQAVRERLDPHGRFSNDYTARVLGPVGAAVAG